MYFCPVVVSLSLSDWLATVPFRSILLHCFYSFPLPLFGSSFYEGLTQINQNPLERDNAVYHLVLYPPGWAILLKGPMPLVWKQIINKNDFLAIYFCILLSVGLWLNNSLKVSPICSWK